MAQTCKSIYKVCNADTLWKSRYADRFNTPIQWLSDDVDSNFLHKDLKPRKDDPVQNLWKRRYEHRKSLGKSILPPPEDPDDDHYTYFNLKILESCTIHQEAALEEERRQYQVTPYRGSQENSIIFIGSTGIPVTLRWENCYPDTEYNFRIYVYSTRKSAWKVTFEICPNFHCQEDEAYFYPLSHTVVRLLTRVALSMESSTAFCLG